MPVPLILAGTAAAAVLGWFGYGAAAAAVNADLPAPPRPAPPSVPPGGYTGPVTDPRAVDWVIADTAARTRAANDEFYRHWEFRQPEPGQGELSALEVGVLLAAVYGVFRLVKGS